MPAPVAAAAAGGGGGAAAGGAGGAAGGGAAGGGAAGGAGGARGAAGARGAGGGTATRAPGGGSPQGAEPSAPLTPQQLQQFNQLVRQFESQRDREEKGDSGGGGLLVVLALSGVVAFVLMIVVLLFPLFVISGIVGGDEAARRDPCGGTDCAVLGDIPRLAMPFREMYENAARVYGVNPFLLMAVHEDESNYGTGEGAGITNGVNFAGCCAGPMQFLITGGASNTVGGSGGTWAGYADAYRRATINRPTSYPNQFSPHPNVYDSFDSIYAAAKYFAGLNAGPQLDDRTYQALLRYKGTPPASIPYARHDYARAKELEAASRTAVGGPLGAMFAKASQIAQAAPPYTWGGGHNSSFSSPYDCSGLVSAVLHAGGMLSYPMTTVGLLSWGEPGRGQLFTVWTRGAGAGGHTFLEFHFNGQSRFIEANGPSGTPAGWRTGKDTSSYTARHWRGM